MDTPAGTAGGATRELAAGEHVGAGEKVASAEVDPVMLAGVTVAGSSPVLAVSLASAVGADAVSVVELADVKGTAVWTP